MCTVRLVYQAEHVMLMRQLDDRTQIRTDTIISRIVYEHRRSIGICLNCLSYLADLHPQRNSQLTVNLRIDINRNRAIKYERVNHTFVYIARQDNFIACLTGGQDHALHGRGRTSYHKECVCRTESLCCQLLCVADYRNRMAEIIKRLHGIDIQVYAFFSQQLAKLRVATTALMTWYIKWHNSFFTKTLQCLVHRSRSL